MKKTAALFSLIRPLNVLITSLVIITGYLISAGSSVSYLLLAAASLSGALTAASGNIINDIFDIESDKINHPGRPLVKNTLSYNAAKRWWFLFTLLSFIISSLINVTAFLIVLAVHLILIFYSFKFKSVPLAGNFIIAVTTAAAFLFGAHAAGNYSSILIPAVFAFLINYIREMVKDVQDLKGDIAAGTLTFPVKYGIRRTKIVIYIFMIILMLLTFYPFAADYYTIEFFLIMMVVVNPLLVYCIKILYASDDQLVFIKVSRILKFNMAAGLAAIFLGQ